MSNIEKIKAEIEGLKGEVERGNYYLDSADMACGYEAALDDLLAFIDSLPEEKPKMIEELKERIVGLDNNGNPIAVAPPDIPMIVEKVNEIIRYLNATQRK